MLSDGLAGDGLAGAGCPSLFARGRAPVLVNRKLATETVRLCYEAFAVLHSGISRTPIYVSEPLTRASVRNARAIDRTDSFHEEERLPEADRARLDDYVRSGFDRGHMAPAGDMPSAAAQAESFSLANVVPQNRVLNRGLWAAIEESVRRLAVARGQLFVVTGTIYAGTTIDSLDGRVLVPTSLFKALYDPARGEAAAYLVANRADAEWRSIPLGELATLSGIDVFPGLAATAMDLPEPRTYSRGDGAGSDMAGGRPKGRMREEPGFEEWALATLHRMARRLLREVLRSIF
ncbi:DNA/RNA non-specific endonuclease [Methylobacterium sp. 77]|uniref:DNA/RNA non-specific endonuclease n=1 Tax=Methylobacterium sp. 77 TaxID=1101192 RepID=UPI001FDA371A|nr:DNA/RNA non-specific endonuclease [Methylobacterium sp. 77]